MKIYVSGPVSGFPVLYATEFAPTVQRLRALAHEVVSPHELNAGLEHEGFTPCMQRGLKALIDCDAIALLEGWEEYRVARIERELALGLGMRVHLAAAITWSGANDVHGGKVAVRFEGPRLPVHYREVQS